MKALVINLDGEAGRLAFQLDQAQRLGLRLERLPAADARHLDPPSGDGYWRRWQRPLREAEKATLLSHRRAWGRIAGGAEPVLVLEDDAWLLPGASSFLDAAARLSGIEHLSLETRGRRKLLGPAHPGLPGIRRLWLDRSGAAAYLLWPRGAARLLGRADRVAGLADAVPVEAPGLLRWQADPALAIQIDMAPRYGLVPPIPVSSAISSEARPPRGDLRFRARRAWAQAAMGATGLRRRLAGAELREVRPAPSTDGAAPQREP
jgi:glycosyl transferase family 25